MVNVGGRKCGGVNQGCARDLLSRDETWDPCPRVRDVQNFVRDETETRRLKSETRRCSFRDAGRDLEAPETLENPCYVHSGHWCVSWESRELQGLAETFSVMYGETHWQWKKLYRLIHSHHGKCFLFLILWVFALYFDNYHWIINDLQHKELQLQCCRHEPLCLSLFASNWN